MERRRVGKPDAASEWGLVLWGRSKAKPASIIRTHGQGSVTSIRSSQRSRETRIVVCRRTLTTNDERARSATGYRGDDIGQGLSRPFHRRLVVSDTPQLLLVNPGTITVLRLTP